MCRQKIREEETMVGALVMRSAAAESLGEHLKVGLRERKKARLRQQIIDTSIKLFRQHGRGSARGGRTRVCLYLRKAEFGAFEQSRYERAFAALVREHGAGSGNPPAIVASGGVVGAHASGATRGTARARGGCRRTPARNSDSRTEAWRSDPCVSSCAPGGVHGRALQHGGAAVGGGSHRAAQADCSGAERGGVFLARHPAVRFSGIAPAWRDMPVREGNAMKAAVLHEFKTPLSMEEVARR